MIVRPQPTQLRALSCVSKPAPLLQTQTRYLHARIPIPKVPLPTPFVPDAQTFLTLIGRNLSQHASKIPSWEALFSLSSQQLKDLGVEPPRNRRYLLRWREKFRNGQFGVGGEADKVIDGIATVRVVEVPTGKSTTEGFGTATLTPGMAKIIVNTEPDKQPTMEELDQLTRIRGLKIKRAHTITGPHVLPTGRGVGKIVIQEGLWEDRRGHKIDGGERRQAEIRAKRRAEERKTTR